MPYIIGGIFKGKCIDSANALFKHVDSELSHTSTHLFQENMYAVNILTGRYFLESSQELIEVDSNKKSMLCGRLFKKNSGKIALLSDLNIEAIVKSHGKELSDNYWGSYILIIISHEGIAFYKDPMGQTTLFYTQIEDGFIFASNIAPLIDFLGNSAALNWAYLTSYIVGNDLITAETPFNGVYEMLPGCETSISLRDKPKLTLFWDPTVISSSFIEDEENYQNQLYDTARMALTSWISGSKKAHITLSGGLDSSSLLALLKISGYKEPIYAINYFDSSFRGGDERDFAQEVSEQYKVSLNFIDFQDHLAFNETKSSKRFNRPTNILLATKFTAALASIMNVEKEDILISGEGGDHVFLASPPREAYIDYLLEKNFHGSANILKDVCGYYRMPYIKLLKETVSIYGHHKLGTLNYLDLVMKPQSWMTESFKNKINQDLFKPIFWENLKNVSPGKARHIMAIFSASMRNSRGNEIPGKSFINPLLSQPLVEHALSMPTYQSFKNGHNRFQFRMAMARNVSGRYLWRTSKGETSGAMVSGIKKNFAHIQSLLLNGRLAEEGFIDTHILHQALREVRSGKVDNLWPINKLFIVESWLSSWY